jgi:hypothetical protein
MPAVRLDDKVRIPSGAEPGAQTDDQGGIAKACTDVSFGHDRIDQYIWRQNLSDGALRVDDDRYFPFLPGAQNPFLAGYPLSDQTFDLFSPFENGFAEGDFPTHGQRSVDFRDADPKARADQPLNYARGHFASTFDQDDQILQPLFRHGSGAFAEWTNRVSADWAPQTQAAGRHDHLAAGLLHSADLSRNQGRFIGDNRRPLHL